MHSVAGDASGSWSEAVAIIANVTIPGKELCSVIQSIPQQLWVHSYDKCGLITRDIIIYPLFSYLSH